MFLNFKGNKKIKKVFFSTSIIALCSIFVYLSLGIILFPSQIYLIAGKENKLMFSSLLNARIEYTDKNCTVNEAMIVSNSNDKKVEDETLIMNLNDNENNLEMYENKSLKSENGEINIVVDENSSVEMSLSVMGIKVKDISVDVLPDIEVVPCGNTVGVKIHTDGVMVLGTGAVSTVDGESKRPSENKLKSGDLILAINGKDINSTRELNKTMNDMESSDEVVLTVKREDEPVEVNVTPAKSAEDNKNKIGVWVRDQTQGIGTLTYYNPETGNFGALGHGILDVDTKKLMSVKTGTISNSKIVTIKKGEKGVPGELIGEIEDFETLGDIKLNTVHGLYGEINVNAENLPKETVKIGLQNEVHEGPAKIISNVAGTERREYDVYIESVNKYSTDDSKGMVIRITDGELLSKTNGIVQGMSGSPIIQDDKLIGAVTHVFVQNPSKGYGIFIENMMKNEKNI